MFTDRHSTLPTGLLVRKFSLDARFFSTSVNKEELGELAQQLDVKCKYIYIQIGIELYDASYCKKANPSGPYPEHTVGLQEAIR